MLSAYLRTYTSYEQLDINSPSRAASGCAGAFGDLHRKVGGILADSGEQAGPRRVQPVQAEDVETRHTRHAPPLGRVAVRIQDGEADPCQIGAVSHRPDRSADARIRQIQLRRRLL